MCQTAAQIGQKTDCTGSTLEKWKDFLQIVLLDIPYDGKYKRYFLISSF